MGVTLPAMTYRAYTVTVWCCVVLMLPAIAATFYAAAHVGVVGAVYTGGPLMILAGIAAIASLDRREPDLAEANIREDGIAHD